MTTPFKFIWFSAHGPRHWDAPDMAVYDWRRPDMYADMAHVLETRGGFEAVVFADGTAINEDYQGTIDTYVKYGLEGVYHDPIPMLAAMSQRTSRIGLVGTLSTFTYPPYLLARLFASLNHLSGGRAAWNLVTSHGSAIAKNFGLDDLPPGAERYARADEFLQVVQRLWDSWDPDAIVQDRADGVFADPSKVHEIDFEGRFYSSRGPLSLPGGRDGRPVLMQAGASDAGRNFAAKHAEMVVSHRNTPEAMKEFRDDIRARMVSIGRDPDTLKIFFTMRPFIGDTAAEARAIRAELMSRATVNTEVGLANYSSRVGLDFSGLPLDEPIDGDAVMARAHGVLGTVQQYTEGTDRPTLREIAMQEAMKETYIVEGDPQMVADEIADVMEYVGGDGIAIRDTLLPSSVLPLTDRVVPLLRARGLVRDGYRFDSFRQNLLDSEFAATPTLSAAAGR